MSRASPTLHEREAYHVQEIAFLNEIHSLFVTCKQNMPIYDRTVPMPMIPSFKKANHDLHILVSKKIKSLRGLRQQKMKGVASLKTKGGREWQNSKYANAIDSCETSISIIEHTLHKVESVLWNICQFGGATNSAADLFATSKAVDLSKQ